MQNFQVGYTIANLGVPGEFHENFSVREPALFRTLRTAITESQHGKLSRIRYVCRG